MLAVNVYPELSHQSVMESDDTHDMKLLCASDEQAFRRVVKRHQQRILAYSVRVTGNLLDAQDISQEVFLTLWRERKRYREKGKLPFYLLKIARLRSLAHLKKQRSGKKLQDKVRAEAENIPDKSTELAEPSHVQASLARLSHEHRDILTLRHFEELSLDEIRDVTGLRMGTIKSRLHRAMAALRKELACAE